jgi:hypothetical protein
MNFDHRQYIPCLRWKRGEYEAVLQLPDTIKSTFMPLIEIPELGWDFEEKKEKKTIDELLSDFALKKICKKWGTSPCFIDLSFISPAQRMKNGVHPIRFIFEELRWLGCQAIPVTGLLRDGEYQREIKAALSKDKNGVCLRITIEQTAKGTFKTDLDSLLSTLKTQSADCDLILDLGAPTNFRPLDGFSMAIREIVNKLPYLNDFRTFTLSGTSFPETMGSIKEGVETVPRYEWQLYKVVVNALKKARLRLPAFGDYVINHPKLLEIDPRIANPSATIRYTIDDSWYIIKGKNVRDKKFGYKQYRNLCKQVLASGYYCGSDFSWGDNYIQECASGTGKTGNLSTWRQVGTNHHIAKVVWDIASFYAS